MHTRKVNEVLSVLKSKVSNALPGNPLIREYEITGFICNTGLGKLWKLYHAKKRSTQQEVTIWELEKRCLESYSKSQRELILECCKAGIVNLTRLKHPKILSIVQSLEESRESLAFASEPLLNALSNLLQLNSSTSSDRSQMDSLSSIEIKYGIMQLSEAFAFLHSDCRRVHLNLVPEAILVNSFGLWKLAGFEFSMPLAKDSIPNSLQSVMLWESTRPSVCQPSLSASAPETVIQGQAGSPSDMFALGLLIVSLYNQGQSFLGPITGKESYKRCVNESLSSPSNKLAQLPDGLQAYVRMMLSKETSVRPDAAQFCQLPIFDDAAMSILRSIDNMFQFDNLARSQFYKSLPDSIHTLPKRLCIYRVFPQITQDFSNPQMVPFILPAVLQIMNVVSKDEFVNKMMSRLTPVFTMKNPIQIILILLKNLRILSEKFPQNEFKIHVLPMIHSALDMDNRTIQELCLDAIPKIASTMDTTMLKNAVLPRIQRLFQRVEIISIRVKCLICMGKLLDYLDKWIVGDDVFPFLQKIRSREPTILVAIMSIYTIALKHERLGIGRDVLACQVLPHLIPLSIDSSLNLKQYSAFAALIRDACLQVEKNQRVKLEQVYAGDDQSNLLGFSDNDPTELWSKSNSCADAMDSLMAALADGSLHFESNKKSTELPTTTSWSSAAATTDPSSTSTPQQQNGHSNHLSLEQKRQLLAQHEMREHHQQHLTPLQPQHHRVVVTSGNPLQPTSLLAPTPVPIKPSSSNSSHPQLGRPIDLTSQLIQSNLTNFTSANQQRPLQPSNSSWGPWPSSNDSLLLASSQVDWSASSNSTWNSSSSTSNNSNNALSEFDKLFG